MSIDVKPCQAPSVAETASPHLPKAPALTRYSLPTGESGLRRASPEPSFRPYVEYASTINVVGKTKISSLLLKDTLTRQGAPYCAITSPIVTGKISIPDGS